MEDHPGWGPLLVSRVPGKGGDEGGEGGGHLTRTLIVLSLMVIGVAGLIALVAVPIP
jgi:hypothetical protein